MRSRTHLKSALVAAAALSAVAATSAWPSATALPDTAPAATVQSRQDTARHPVRLENRRPCASPEGYDCATLRVPLDHSGTHPGTLRLHVAMTRNDGAPRGVLLFLTGGPGQPGVGFIDSAVHNYLTDEVTDAYQVVTIDQRGTGAGALECPKLQAAVGGSDYWFTPRRATRACGLRLGDTRGFYSTDDTVRDLDLLRQALDAPSMAIDGVSYGTFVGEQYGRTFPGRVSHLVLDSPVPQDGFDPVALRPMRATGRVLRGACREDDACTTHPAADLAWLVRHGAIDGRPIDGTQLLDGMAILSVSTINPTFAGVPKMLADARAGDTDQLATFLDSVSPTGTRPEDLDAGLRLATLCSDLRFPWGDSSAPQGGRRRAARRALADVPPRRLWPYDRRTAARVLEISGCTAWQPTPPTRFHRGPLRTRTLLLSGEHDLFCPLPWARRQLRHTPRGRLVVLPDGGHATQRGNDPASQRAVTDFVL